MLLIKNGIIFTMSDKDYMPGSVLIDKGKIIEVDLRIDIDETACEVIDARDCWVLPGLIDAHSHIGITEEKKGFEGDDCNEMTNPITPNIRAIDGINPMDPAFHNAICSGITSVIVGPGSTNVVGGQFAFIKTNGRSIDDMIVLEPAAMKVAFGENPKMTYKENGVMPTTRMSIAAMLRQELFSAKQYQQEKLEAQKEGATFEQIFKKDSWLPVLEKKIPLKVHAHRADDILTAIRIAKEFDLNITLDHCTEGHLVKDEIKQSGFPAIIGPSLSTRTKIEVRSIDFKTVGILSKEGIKVAITTDHPVSRLQYLPICAGLAVKEGLDMREGLKAITINAAEICNVSDRVGSMEKGKDADIAIFDGNPMEVFTKTLYTIIDGKIVYNHKHSINASTTDLSN